ncbi:hypothetical protein PIB30_078708 [Stylosanthes scabra]|uniref:Uncharacterized protein n=1 Tax=Stylosanthes scabra TaxID=79078 RepID=A0ABU6ZPH4_9FABA|nr:hypothetical protein [Stylosanthes scabra]
MNSPENKADKKRDEPKVRSTHREIAMISGGILEEGNPLSKKAAKRSQHSCLIVEVMPRTLEGKPPPAKVFADQGSSSDILLRRCFDALGLTEKDLEAHSDDLVGFSRERVTDAGLINPRSRQVYRIVSSNTTVKWVSIPRGLKD